jgi:glutaredoxin
LREHNPNVRLLDTDVQYPDQPVPTPSTDRAAADSDGAEIVVYWRPGCGFCRSLFQQLEHAGIGHRRINIWDDPDAAATVRSIASGSETVPTVTIGSVALVNPSVRDIVSVARGT